MNQTLEWKDGAVPVSTRFDDPYFSLQDGLAETRHVFLCGNDLPQRFVPDFRIAELGFGTGLNLLAAWQLWREAGLAGQLRFTSFEAFPIERDDMARALAAFPEIDELTGEMMDCLKPCGFETDDLCFTLVTGDARQTVPEWTECADAWFLDGFSPAKNPELWEPDLMTAIGAKTNSGGTVATYTAAGHVRRALEAAGFEISRVSGYGRKRHMTRGVLRG